MDTCMNKSIVLCPERAPAGLVYCLWLPDGGIRKGFKKYVFLCYISAGGGLESGVWGAEPPENVPLGTAHV